MKKKTKRTQGRARHHFPAAQPREMGGAGQDRMRARSEKQTQQQQQWEASSRGQGDSVAVGSQNFPRRGYQYEK